MSAPSPIRVPTQSRLRAAIARAAAAASWWSEQTPIRPQTASAPAGPTPYLLSVPDIGLACEVLLADRLFHDLSTAERDGLAEGQVLGLDLRREVARDLALIHEALCAAKVSLARLHERASGAHLVAFLEPLRW